MDLIVTSGGLRPPTAMTVEWWRANTERELVLDELENRIASILQRS